ncbi:hypothetical protein GX48_07273 [Paracoccidioides brasiliensis]|nr:hypothetical protein GX48_07273 [Paracoccidioides brasiliensis]
MLRTMILLDFTIAGFLSLLIGKAVAKLPYNPSYISNPTSENQTELYILSPPLAPSTGFRLQSLNISAPFNSSELPITELRDNVPFATDDGEQTFIATTDAEGVLTVYTGDCHTNTSNVWRLLPGNGVSSGNFQWQKSSVHGDEGNPGPAFLSSAITYPATGDAPRPDLFVFGGMCPFTVGRKNDDWVSSANYSQTMVSLTAEGSSSNSSYQFRIVTSRSPPVAEAGFAMTPMIPAYSNTSSGKLLEHRSFVLTGGHTQNAFVSMSQIALFSLPEATWSFVSVSQEGINFPKLDLGDIDGIEPRSGHTAVMTPDGSKIIVFGGWVGDISTPAQPQLAILEVGKSYGGTGDWRWTVPKQNILGPKDGTGIFGHGAAMLPGGIMLVAGGFSIHQSTSKQSFTTLIANTQGYLFNTSSGSWIASYTPVNWMESSPIEMHGPLSSTAQKAGLGMGVGIGIIIVAVLVSFIYRISSRHSRDHRRIREQELRRLALGAERPHFDLSGNIHDPVSHVTTDKLSLHPNAHFSFDNEMGGRLHGSQKPGALAAERTELLVEISSPTKGLRRGMHSRGYQPALHYDNSRKNVGFSAIHPIDEGDEYEDSREDESIAAEKGETHRENSSSVISNPFRDPAQYSESHSAGHTQRRMSAFYEKSAPPEWIDDVNANGSGNRCLPLNKSDRTPSNLSEASGSSLSVYSHQTNPLYLNKNLAPMLSFRSQRNGGSAGSSSIGYEPIRSSSPEKHNQYQSHLQPTTSSSFNPVNDLSPEMTQSSNTTITPLNFAHNSSFSQLQAKSGLLLGTAPLESSKRSLNLSKFKGLGLINNSRRTIRLVRRTEDPAEPYPVCSENVSTMQRRRSTSTNTSRSKSLYSFHDDRESTGSETNSIPRRAVSTSSSMLRRKQGAKDWGAKRSFADNEMLPAPRGGNSHANGPALSDGGACGIRRSDSAHFFDYDDEEEWDVEAAAEGRLVQVTYTVPKEKLRVVNPGVGDGDDNSVR